MKEKNGVTLSSQVIHAGKVFAAVNEHVELPTGRQVKLDIIRHNRSVVLLPMPDSNHIVLVRQYRHTIKQWMWELPAGNVENDEHPDDAAHRECTEETGLKASSIERLGAFFSAPGYCDEEMHFYRLTGLTPVTETELDTDEILEPHTLSLDHARRLMSKRQIIDMKTALGLTFI
tara:strand:- start:968 stop:1492 length:525 start_codon:yes stop_codon:yes gene_type:complete